MWCGGGGGSWVYNGVDLEGPDCPFLSAATGADVAIRSVNTSSFTWPALNKSVR